MPLGSGCSHERMRESMLHGKTASKHNLYEVRCHPSHLSHLSLPSQTSCRRWHESHEALSHQSHHITSAFPGNQPLPSHSNTTCDSGPTRRDTLGGRLGAALPRCRCMLYVCTHMSRYQYFVCMLYVLCTYALPVPMASVISLCCEWRAQSTQMA